LDAVSKVEDLRDRKRVERIGKILAHAIMLPMSDFDKAEEMMRVARDLSDADVLGLRHLYETQFDALQLHGLHSISTRSTAFGGRTPLLTGYLVSSNLSS
jgi:hypothetical protein